MRISHTAQQIVQEGSQNTTVLTRGSEAVYETITEHTSYIMKLAAAATNVELDLGGLVTVKTLWLSADQDVTVRLVLNTNYAIDVKADFPLAIVMATGVTAIFVTNGAGVEAELSVVLGG